MSLSKLIEAVERGDADFDWGFAASPSRKALPENWHDAMNAYLGSLDAAKRLHDALLPGWGWETGANATFASIAQVWKSGRDKAHVATSETPARAFLLAILRALEQEGRDG